MASAQIVQQGKALYAYTGEEWIPLNGGNSLVNATRWQKTLSASASLFSGDDDFGDPLIYTPEYEQLYLNGILLARNIDYTAENGLTIELNTPANDGDIVEILALNNISVANTYTKNQIDTKIADTFNKWVKTLSASATVLSGEDNDSNILSYTPGLEKVYVNGILLAPEEYVATSGSSVILDEAGVENDIIQIQTFKNFRIANHYTINQTDDKFLSKNNGTANSLNITSGSANLLNIIQPNITTKPLIIKSTAPQTATITGATVSSGSVTYSIANANTIFTAGDLVTITGINPSTLNDTRATVGSVSASAITIFNGKQGTYVSGGTATRIHANLLEIQNSAGTPTSTIRSDGSVTGELTGGLVHIKELDFTGVTSQSFNNVFTSSFTNYLVTFDGSTADNVAVRLRLRASGTDATTNYNIGRLFGNTVTASATGGGDPDITPGGASRKSSVVNIFRPQLAVATSMVITTSSFNGTVGTIQVFHTTTDPYDGFTLFAPTGNINSAKVNIYGYKD